MGEMKERLYKKRTLFDNCAEDLFCFFHLAKFKAAHSEHRQQIVVNIVFLKMIYVCVMRSLKLTLKLQINNFRRCFDFECVV